jgi:hypothetical protein
MHAFITHRDLILHAPQGHNFIPEADMMLEMKDWCTLANTSAAPSPTNVPSFWWATCTYCSCQYVCGDSPAILPKV